MDQKNKNIHQLSVPIIPSGGSDPEAAAAQQGSSTPGNTINGLAGHVDSLRSTPSEPSPSPPWNTESFARRRASSVHLPPLNTRRLDSHDNVLQAEGASAANNDAAAAEVDEETVDETIEHFTGFLVNEIVRNGMQHPPDLQEDIQR